MTTWTVKFMVYRQKGQSNSHYDEFTLKVNPEEYVLDAIERIWAFFDRSLCFAHACHHSTCGACGMRVNGVEKLTCITLIRSVTKDGGTVRVDPLRNFPIISDLAVDMGRLYVNNEATGQKSVISCADEPANPKLSKEAQEAERDFIRLSDCIECGLCVSACPVATTTSAYLGPAALAGAHQRGLDHDNDILQIVNSENGVWRCHSAFECSAVCPSNVDPAARIMALRKQVMVMQIKNMFRRN